MGAKKNLAAGLAAIGLALGLPMAVQAQQEPVEPPGDVAELGGVLEGVSIRLTVNGMVCPFCAYGLEKRLKDVPGVDAVLIHISDGLVQIRVADGQDLSDEELKKTVAKAGFTLTEIERVDR